VSAPVSGELIALVAHARHAPASERSTFAARLRDELPGNALIVETCHRAEAYLAWPGVPERLAALVALPPDGRILVGESAVRHAVELAVGRDSVVVGENEILHQLRESVDAARRRGSLDPQVERLFALALQAGRRARSWHQGPRRSLADVALSSIEQRRGPLRGAKILVVGAGRMGALAVRAAIAAGATASIANRSASRAEQLAAAIGAMVEPFDPGRHVATYDGIVVAIAGPWAIGRDTIDALRASQTVVVDLSVPVAVSRPAAAAVGSRFVSADMLALTDAEPATPEDGLAARLDSLVEKTTAAYLGWLGARTGRAAAEALIERADRQREAELAVLWRQLPDLQPDARDAIEGMTRHLARRLLREPLERLGRDSDGRDERAVRDIFAL
jgi:glutamyl-tRNA reductase